MTGAPSGSLLLVDDHAILADALARTLRLAGWRVTEARSLAEADAALAREPFTLVVVDLNLPDGDGYQLVDRLAAIDAAPRVLVLTASTDAHDVARAAGRRVTGFLHKTVGFGALTAAIAAATAAAPDARLGVWDEAAGGFRPFAETADEATLTPREEEIYALLRAGCADKEIAHRLGRSIHTVRVHIRAVMRKRRVNRRASRVGAG